MFFLFLPLIFQYPSSLLHWAGNLLVDVNTLKPVLLDFGLTKEVTPEARFHFSKLLVSAAEQGTVLHHIYIMYDLLISSIQ